MRALSRTQHDELQNINHPSESTVKGEVSDHSKSLNRPGQSRVVPMMSVTAELQDDNPNPYLVGPVSHGLPSSLLKEQMCSGVA